MSATATREALHLLCARVLATRRFVGTGRLGLDVVGDQIISVLEDGEPIGLDERGLHFNGQTTELTTIAAAAAFVGIDPAAPVHEALLLPCDPDAALTVDPLVTRDLIAYFTTVKTALSTWRASLDNDDDATDPVLWPEHFDLAIVAGAPEFRANYGGSPGDSWNEEPYLYVGPFVSRTGPRWNAPFGSFIAARTMTTTQMVEYFASGRSDLDADPRPA